MKKNYKKLLLSIITITAFGFGASAQIVNIPDANFKAYLVGNTAINTNGDTEIQVSEASAFTGQIIVFSMSISDLTGVEAFTGITHLKCYDNSLTTLDVSQNTSLGWLTCNVNSLTSLDLSSNTLLYHLECNNNLLTTLDLSNNPALTFMFCFNMSSLTALNMASGGNTSLSTFNSTNCPNLTCIQVDNAAYSTTNWTNIDATASFSTNCSVGINEITNQNISVYPNPASNLLTIENGELKIKSITILDITGKTVKTIVSNTNTIDISNLTKGVYFLQVQTENGSVNSKFIKK